jgi:indole-3-glycerol phosphate synthase
MSALDRIIAYKQSEVSALKASRPLVCFEGEAAMAPAPRGFITALEKAETEGRNALICEIKRKSPSAGEIRPGAEAGDIAAAYEAAGAACLSILTDCPSFGGSLGDLVEGRGRVSLPVLRKDFMIDPVQVYEARAHGADAILVIMAALDDVMAAELTDLAHSLGMDVLVEVHDEAELERALALPVRLIGVNNRNLKTMVTDLSTTERLAMRIDPSRLIVAESGIKTAMDVNRLRDSRARAFLIGESLMRPSDIASAALSLIVRTP